MSGIVLRFRIKFKSQFKLKEFMNIGDEQICSLDIHKGGL